MQIDNQIDGAFPRVNMQKLLSPKHENEPCLSLNIITLPSGTKGNNLIQRFLTVFQEDRLFRLFKIETSPISLNLDYGLILRLMMILKTNTADSFPSDPQSTFLMRLQNSGSKNDRMYFEEISIKLGEVHASLYKVGINFRFFSTFLAIRTSTTIKNFQK